MSNNIRDQLKEVLYEEGLWDDVKDNARSFNTLVKETTKKTIDAVKNARDNYKIQAQTTKNIIADEKLKEKLRRKKREIELQQRELEAQNKKEFKLTPTTKIVGGTALAAGLGLGAHYLYRKHKKNKKIRASMKKKM